MLSVRNISTNYSQNLNFKIDKQNNLNKTPKQNELCSYDTSCAIKAQNLTFCAKPKEYLKPDDINSDTVRQRFLPEYEPCQVGVIEFYNNDKTASGILYETMQEEAGVHRILYAVTSDGKNYPVATLQKLKPDDNDDLYFHAKRKPDNQNVYQISIGRCKDANRTQEFLDLRKNFYTLNNTMPKATGQLVLSHNNGQKVNGCLITLNNGGNKTIATYSVSEDDPDKMILERASYYTKGNTKTPSKIIEKTKDNLYKLVERDKKGNLVSKTGTTQSEFYFGPKIYNYAMLPGLSFYSVENEAKNENMNETMPPAKSAEIEHRAIVPDDKRRFFPFDEDLKKHNGIEVIYGRGELKGAIQIDFKSPNAKSTLLLESAKSCNHDNPMLISAETHAVDGITRRLQKLDSSDDNLYMLQTKNADGTYNVSIGECDEAYQLKKVPDLRYGENFFRLNSDSIKRTGVLKLTGANPDIEFDFQNKDGSKTHSYYTRDSKQTTGFTLKYAQYFENGSNTLSKEIKRQAGGDFKLVEYENGAIVSSKTGKTQDGFSFGGNNYAYLPDGDFYNIEDKENQQLEKNSKANTALLPDTLKNVDYPHAIEFLGQREITDAYGNVYQYVEFKNADGTVTAARYTKQGDGKYILNRARVIDEDCYNKNGSPDNGYCNGMIVVWPKSVLMDFEGKNGHYKLGIKDDNSNNKGRWFHGDYEAKHLDIDEIAKIEFAPDFKLKNAVRYI